MANTILQLDTSNLGLIFARTLAEARKTLLPCFNTIREMGGDTLGVKAAIDQGSSVSVANVTRRDGRIVKNTLASAA